jgi:hypothetical protein
VRRSHAVPAPAMVASHQDMRHSLDVLRRI